MAYHNKMQFSTKDRDNDAAQSYDCAVKKHGGWWYNNCYKANLNGDFKASSGGPTMKWLDKFKCQTTEMKVRRKA